MFRDVLPVKCLETDDLLESTASFDVRSTIENHPILDGIDFSGFPPILGFKQTKRRTESETLLEIKYWDQWFPLLSQHSLGKGRVSAWMTGASPHWGINLIKWDQYDQFWKQLFTYDGIR